MTSVLVLPGAATVPGHAAGTPSYRRLVVALMAGGLANFSLMYFVQPLLPQLAAHYGVTPAESAHALSATTLAIIAGLVATGPLADRWGRVRVMRWSLLASAVLGLASALAPTWPLLVATRAMLGLTLAGLPGAALPYLREEVDATSHPRANAAYIVGTAAGGAIGRLLPGPLAALGGWPLAAGAMSLVTLGAGIALVVLLPESRRFAARRVGLVPAVLGSVRALGDRVVLALCVAGFAAMGAFVAVYNATAFRLQAPPFSLGTSASLVYLAYPLAITSPLLARPLAERAGRGYATLVGLGVLAVAVVALVPDLLTTVVAGLALVAAAFLGTHSLLSGWVVDRAQRRGRGTAQASSAYLATYYLGSTLAGALATSLWQSGGWPGVATLALFLCAVSLAATVLATRADRNPHGATDDAAALP